MPHTDPDLRDPADDWLDAVLATEGTAHRDDYVDDAGFTSRVMARLPAPAALPRWRKPVLATVWASAGLGLAYALPGTALDVTRSAIGLLAGRSVSLYEIVAIVAVLGIATWTGTAVAVRRA